ncbi:MAG: DUF1552 domain-containing protein [Deltaproteobacteria bacterium]|nr:DUF1552 domain-containing protein [Deltaproteobacteria bacterium]
MSVCSRRTLLRALGIGGASLVLPSAVRTRPASAGGATSPQRVIFFVTQHGPYDTSWRMAPNGASDDVAWERDITDVPQADWSPILAPLHRHRNRLLMLDGLSNGALLNSPLTQYHQSGRATLLTNSHFVWDDGGDATGGARSFDQILADSLATPGQQPFIYCGASQGPEGQIRPISFAGEGSPAGIESDPVALFEKLYPQRGMDPSAQLGARSIAQRQSVLDFVAPQLDAFASTLSGEDRLKLEQHGQLVRDLEQQLVPLECGEAPAMPRGDDLEQFFQLVALAVSCDATRVATIQTRQMTGDEFGHPGSDVHQDFAHIPHSPEMADYFAVRAEQFASFLDVLEAIPEGNGTLLDNTLVAWIPELGSGNHDAHGFEIVLAGNLDGAFDTGRYVYWPRDQANPSITPSDYNQNWGNPVGPPHGRLLVSIAQALGLELDQVNLGTVSGSNGIDVNLGGALDRLTARGG